MRLADPDDPIGFAAARKVLTGVSVTLVILAIARHFRTGMGEAPLVVAAVVVLVGAWLLEPVLRLGRRRAP